MSEQKTYHMSAADFRRHGRAVVDWIADYYEQIESLRRALPNCVILSGRN